MNAFLAGSSFRAGFFALQTVLLSCGAGSSSVDAAVDAGGGPLPVEWSRSVMSTPAVRFDAVGDFGRIGLIFSDSLELVTLDGEGNTIATGELPDVYVGPTRPLVLRAEQEEDGRLRVAVRASSEPIQEILLDESLNLIGTQETGCLFLDGAAVVRAADRTWVLSAANRSDSELELSLCSLSDEGASEPALVETGTPYNIDGRGLAVLSDGRLIACVTGPPPPPMPLGERWGSILVINPLAAAGPAVVDRHYLGPGFLAFTCELIETPAGIAAVWNGSTMGLTIDVGAALLSSADGSLLAEPTPLDNNLIAPARWVHHDGYLYGVAVEPDGQYMVRVDAATLAVQGRYLFLPYPGGPTIYSAMAVSDGTSLFAVDLRQAGAGRSIYLTKVGAFPDH